MPALKQKDKLTADNTVTSEEALKLLGLLPDNYESLSNSEKQKAKESRVRYLKRLEKTEGLKRFKNTGRGWKYFKSQCIRIFEEAAEENKNLLAI